MEDSDILKEIRNNNTREKEVIQALEKKDSKIWEEEKKLKERILEENYDLVDVEHPGQ